MRRKARIDATATALVPRRRHKYGAVATVVDGIRFASKKEARRYQELKLLERAGEITNLELQPRYPLYVLSYSVEARLHRAAARIRGNIDRLRGAKIGEWRGDFRYDEKTLSASENDHYQRVVEDVKGFKTPLYRWKKKHVEAQYGITIREI